MLDPLYLTSHSDPVKFPYFSDGETEAWRLNYLPKAILLSKQQSQDSNTNQNTPNPKFSFKLKMEEGKEGKKKIHG